MTKKISPLLPTPRSASLLPFFIFLSILLATTPNVTHAAPPAQAPETTPSVSQGRLQWTENCQPCHGPTGQGDGPTAESIPGPLPDFSNPETARQLVPAENFETIKNGRIEKLMPPWGDQLSDAQIWDAAAYVWSLSTTSQNLATGETLYLEQCAACHGQGGAGDGPEAPAEMPDFTDLETMAQRSQVDLHANFQASDQHTQLGTLSDDELWQTLDYIRTFTFAVPQRNGVLTGQVINATTNEPVGNVEITLRVFQDNSEIETLTTQADGNGRYSFEKLLTEHTVFYILEGRYQDIVYTSDDPGVFVPNSTETTLDLKVYETTTRAEAINVSQLHNILTFAPGAISVIEIFVLSNNGDRTYLGQDGQTFAFNLPANATGVLFQEEGLGTRFVKTDDGYADTEPVRPGETSQTIIARYDLPFDGDALTINIPIPAEVASLSVLMSDQGAKLNSAQVEFIESRQMVEGTFSIFTGANLSQGDTLTLELTNLDNLEFTDLSNPPGTTIPGNQVDQNLLRWIIIGLGGLAIITAGVIYPLTRPQLAHHQGSHYNDPQTQRQKLLLLLARLDDTFEAGELDEAVYRRARAKYKAELARIMEAWR